MTDILGTLAQQRRQFIPSKPIEYLALQLAKKLNDQEAVRYYLTLFDRHEANLLLRVFRQCGRQGHLSGPGFMRLLKQLTESES